MFPLIAITAFFILGIAFFAIGKDDFGITRLKEVPTDTTKNEKEIAMTDQKPSEKSSMEKESMNPEAIENSKATENMM